MGSGGMETVYREFCAAHPYRRVVYDGAVWEVVLGGQARETLVLLPGALSQGQTAFQWLRAFEGRYRVVAPTYPPLSRLTDLLGGLAGLLDALGCDKVHVQGGSFSGLVAQAFVRRYPDRVRSLTLSDTGVPSPGRSLAVRLLRACVDQLPPQATRRLMALSVESFVRQIRRDAAFWRGHFKTRLAVLTRREILAHLDLWLDLDGLRFAPTDLADWPGRVLILEAASDSIFPAHQRAAVRRLYTQAQTQRFPDLGHSASLAHADLYIRCLAEFLACQAR
ncbi:MAG: alpha/beta hydrolase [Anaerolineae bacterium]|nr:alpha/beta hydrolase [Anaerolineae bacterium]